MSAASRPPLAELEPEAFKASCAALYAHPAVRWLLGGELHPGGARSTRRALELLELAPGARLLDVASGGGDSALLAASELGCEAVGVEYGAVAVAAASEAAAAAGLDDRVSFAVGDAERLPVADASFDAVLCECSLCTFGDQPRAVAEIRRALRPGGRVAICDVVVERDRLPAELRGSLAALACVGEARSGAGLERLLAGAGLRPLARESRAADAAALAERVHDRLRGARLLGLDRLAEAPVDVGAAAELVATAREAIAAGTLGYEILVAAG